MADDPDLTYFLLTGHESAVVADTNDALTDPDKYEIWVPVTITARPEVCYLTTTTPPKTKRIRPINARIETGVLRLIGGSAPVNEEQLVTVTGNPFTLTYSGQTTGSIASTATKTQVEAALVALSNLASGDVQVVGANGGPFTVFFQGNLAATNVPQMTATNATVSTVDQGAANAGVRLPANTAVLGLDGLLLYDVAYGKGKINGVEVNFEDQNFTFAAPVTDLTLDLTTVSRVSGPAAGQGSTPITVNPSTMDDLTDAGDSGKALVRTGTLDETWNVLGVVPTVSLPSYVDDVLEFVNLAGFPVTGETGKIYVDKATGDSYRWSGSGYIRISDRITATGITDSTAVGRAVVTAADAAAARTAIGAGTASTKADVGLGSVDNTADTAKPVSTAQQTALDLKAPLASPAFTGTPTGITKTHVGLGNVDNTSDANKPVSTAQAAADTAVLTASQLALANANNSGPSLLMDGSYEQDATWWAQEISPVDTHNTLSTDQAYSGTQSMKWVGPTTHYPNVTAAGKAGSDATYGYAKTTAGRVYRLSFWVYRGASNTSTGLVRGGVSLKGAGGSDLLNGTSINQSTLTTGVWTKYSTIVTVPVTGTNAPYGGVAPYITFLSVDAADVFYVDNVRFDDLTDAPVELLAPPPTGDRTTDTANVQALVDLVQVVGGGTIVLRGGTYAMDIVTARVLRQPVFIGQGEQVTLWDGTLRMLGVAPGGSQYAGGGLSDFSWTGSHAGSAALELNGVCDVHWDRVRVQGTFDRGILFHNELSGHFTELCSGRMHFGTGVTTAVEYRVGAGGASFHQSGLLVGSAIQQSTSGPPILIGTNARPYNAPMSVGVWTEAVTTYPVIQHNGQALSNFFGNLTVEQNATAAPLAAGNTIYYVGGISGWAGSVSLPLNKGTLTQIMAGVQAVSGGTLTPIPVSLMQGGELDLYNTADQATNYERAFLRWVANVLTIGMENGGTGTLRALTVQSHGKLIMSPTAVGPTTGTIQLFDSTNTANTCIAAVTGTGGASSGTQYGLAVTPIYNQSATAGYVAFFVNVTETAIGSGSHKLISAQLASVEKFSVDDAGNAFMGGTLDLGHASDTTISRLSAGQIAVESIPVVLRTTQTVTSAVTIGAVGDFIVFIGASGAPTLPTAVGNTGKYTFKNIHSASRVVATTSSQTIESLTTYTLPAGASIDVVSDGSNWRII